MCVVCVCMCDVVYVVCVCECDCVVRVCVCMNMCVCGTSVHTQLRLCRDDMKRVCLSRAIGLSPSLFPPL